MSENEAAVAMLDMGRPHSALELNPSVYLGNVEAALKNAFAYVIVSEESLTIAEQLRHEARTYAALASDIFARDKEKLDAARSRLHIKFDELGNSLRNSRKSDLARALGL